MNKNNMLAKELQYSVWVHWP